MAFIDTLVRRYRSERTRDMLSGLTDRQLDDIGLSRSDVVDTRKQFSADKPFGLRGIV
ncbi:MAG: DUF1127 domain-containing protein [Pseudomonadota bacterium]